MMLILIWQLNRANLKNKVHITSKDYKNNFPYKVVCRQINSLKQHIKKIDKKHLKQNNKSTISLTQVHQLKTANMWQIGSKTFSYR